MSTTAPLSSSLVRNGARLLTLADVAALPRHLPSGDVDYELHNGELIVTAPFNSSQARGLARFLAHLSVHGEQRGYGEVYGTVGIVLRRYPDHLRAPNAAFLTTAQLPPQTSPEGYLVTIPELVVEVRSKNDTQPEIDEKVNDYLAAGVLLVWVADPGARTVTAHQPGQAPVVFTTTDTLTALPVIPGFAVLVGDLLPV